MTALIVALPSYGLLAIMTFPIYGWLTFGSISFDYLLYAGFGFFPRNEKLAESMRRSRVEIDERYAKLSAFLTGLILAAISYGSFELALYFLEVWLGQS